MKPFVPVYVPVGVPTFHMESAQDAFERSAAALKAMDGDFVCPEDKLLSLDALRGYLDPLAPDLIVFQNLTFANAAYMAEVLRRTSCPVVLWTLREPVIDGGRLRLNSRVLLRRQHPAGLLGSPLRLHLRRAGGGAGPGGAEGRRGRR